MLHFIPVSTAEVACVQSCSGNKTMHYRIIFGEREEFNKDKENLSNPCNAGPASDPFGCLARLDTVPTLKLKLYFL